MAWSRMEKTAYDICVSRGKEEGQKGGRGRGQRIVAAAKERRWRGLYDVYLGEGPYLRLDVNGERGRAGAEAEDGGRKGPREVDEVLLLDSHICGRVGFFGLWECDYIVLGESGIGTPGPEMVGQVVR